jgi:hypothetical protein
VTIINQDATLQLGAGGAAGTIAGAVSDGGTLVFDHTNAETFSNAVSGSGHHGHQRNPDAGRDWRHRRQQRRGRGGDPVPWRR